MQMIYCTVCLLRRVGFPSMYYSVRVRPYWLPLWRLSLREGALTRVAPASGIVPPMVVVACGKAVVGMKAGRSKAPEGSSPSGLLHTVDHRW